jgi:hypothetical protein
LKEALRVAISTRDEYYHKVMAYDKALADESRKAREKDLMIKRLLAEKVGMEDRVADLTK